MIKEREANSWKSVSYAKSISGAQTYTKFPIVLRTTEQSIPTWNVKGNMVQSGTGTTTVPSKNVIVSNLESGTNYAMFSKTDFPDVAVGDSISIVVGSTTYSQKVKKIDSSYVYIENRTV